MNFNNISAASIRNPIPVVLLFIILTVAGVLSYFAPQAARLMG